MPEIQTSIGNSHTEFLESVSPDVNPHDFDGLVPQLWSHFHRMTLVHNTAEERVTIDTQVSFYDNSTNVTLPRVFIVEVKQPRDDRQSAVRQQFRKRGIRPLRISKYCIGSVLLNPELKHNRFKSKLRSLQQMAAS